MKSLIKLFLFLIFFNFAACMTLYFTLSPTPVYALKTYFARVPSSGTFIYSSPENLQDYQIFELPETYFVELLESANDQFYYCHYQDVYGYVLKNLVVPVKNAPTEPYLTNICFRVFVPSGANLRSTPKNLGSVNLLYSIPYLDSNLSYYGRAYGDESIPQKGNLWYYCKYFNSNQSYTGYVYAPLCDCLDKINDSTEYFEPLEGEPVFDEPTAPTSGEVLPGLSGTTATVVIVLVCLPCLLFIYLLFKPTLLAEAKPANKTSQTVKKKDKKKIKRLKHSDYFELDDDF